ncbi:hypothetical protein ACWIUO_13230, partial [Helicobacter sp. T3_23-1056]
FINPPYAEASSAKARTSGNGNKAGVSVSEIYEKYFKLLGRGVNEVFSQFFIRIHEEIPSCTLASFGKLKYINSNNFIKFRETFKAKFLKGFAIPAYTFDNVSGQFPIGFLIWNLADKKDIKKIKLDIFNENNKRIGKKNFYTPNKNKKNIFISDWVRNFYDKNNENLAWLTLMGADFQSQNSVYISTQPTQNNIRESKVAQITKYNLIPICIYFAVRHAIKSSWINDRDQFLFPKNKWRGDSEFHNDCLAYALFHSQNRISANLSPSLAINTPPQTPPARGGAFSISPSIAEGDKGGGLKSTNHFIPFSEQEVGAKEAFRSDFMVRFINGKVKNGTLLDCFVPNEKMTFSSEAKAVFSAGLELWRYYHAQAKSSEKYLNDASLYDIKEYFQGRSESKNGKQGKLNAKSEDSHYNDLLANLRLALNDLATKIQPKIYEYEFLLE